MYPQQDEEEIIEITYSAPKHKINITRSFLARNVWGNTATSTGTYLDSGYFYAPYIPLTTAPVVLTANCNW